MRSSRTCASTVTSIDLFKAYIAWCDESGEKPTSQRFLGLRLGEHGFVRARMPPHNRWGWKGIRLRDEGELFSDEFEDPAIEVKGVAASNGATAPPDPADFATTDEYLAASRNYFDAHPSENEHD